MISDVNNLLAAGVPSDLLAVTGDFWRRGNGKLHVTRDCTALAGKDCEPITVDLRQARREQFCDRCWRSKNALWNLEATREAARHARSALIMLEIHDPSLITAANLRVDARALLQYAKPRAADTCGASSWTITATSHQAAAKLAEQLLTAADSIEARLERPVSDWLDAVALVPLLARHHGNPDPRDVETRINQQHRTVGRTRRGGIRTDILTGIVNNLLGGRGWAGARQRLEDIERRWHETDLPENDRQAAIEVAHLYYDDFLDHAQQARTALTAAASEPVWVRARTRFTARDALKELRDATNGSLQALFCGTTVIDELDQLTHPDERGLIDPLTPTAVWVQMPAAVANLFTNPSVTYNIRFEPAGPALTDDPDDLGAVMTMLAVHGQVPLTELAPAARAILAPPQPDRTPGRI